MPVTNAINSARVFFALWPASTERAALAAWQPLLHAQCGGRAMRVETLHNTLVFIGDVEQSRLETLTLAAREVDAEDFELCFDAAKYWGHNRIVYASPGVVPHSLAQLVGMLEQRLVTHHFKLERREYKPHVTLLRDAKWTDIPLPSMQPVYWQVSEFALVQSVRRNEAASYQVLEKYPLRVG